MTEPALHALPKRYYGKSGVALFKLPFAMVFSMLMLYLWIHLLWTLLTGNTKRVAGLLFMAVFILLPFSAWVFSATYQILNLAGNNKALLVLSETGVNYRGREVKWSDIVSIQLAHEYRGDTVPSIALHLHPQAAEHQNGAILWIRMRDVKAEEFLLRRELNQYWQLLRQADKVS